MSSGLDNGARSGFLVFWFGKKKVCSLTDVGLHDRWFGRHFRMVLLGFLTGFLTTSNEWIHW